MVNVRVEVYNVNYTENAAVQAALIERSQSLKEYSQFIYQLQLGKQQGLSFEEALKQAVDYCVEHHIMHGFLEKHGSEVRNMLYTEWNLEDACRVAAEEAREQAREQGIAIGMERGIAKGMEKGIIQGEASSIRKLKDILPPEVLAEKFQLPLEDVLRILEADSAAAMK